MWVLDHLDDLDADFLAIYRVDDIESLSGPRFLALAARTAAYQGVMAARIAAQQQAGSEQGGEVRQVDADQASIAADPALGSLVSWGGA